MAQMLTTEKTATAKDKELAEQEAGEESSEEVGNNEEEAKEEEEEELEGELSEDDEQVLVKQKRIIRYNTY